MPLARISLTLSRHFSLSFIATSMSSGLHPVSSHSWCMYVRAGRPAFARPYVGVHMSTSLMSSSLLSQQCPACLVRLTWIIFVMGGRWPYSWCLVGCCCQDLFNIVRKKKKLLLATKQKIHTHTHTHTHTHIYVYTQNLRTRRICRKINFTAVNRFEFSFPYPRPVAIDWLKSQSALLFTHWMHTFTKGISAMWNANSLKKKARNWQYLAETIADANYPDDLTFLSNIESHFIYRIFIIINY